MLVNCSVVLKKHHLGDAITKFEEPAIVGRFGLPHMRIMHEKILPDVLDSVPEPFEIVEITQC